METQHRLIDQGMENRLGAFPIGPVFGDDVVPVDPVEAMRTGRAHRVPLIVGTNAEEGRLFTRFLKMLPTNQTMIEELLADTDPAARERITAAYPDYPAPSACIQLGGDFAFSSAAWQIAEAHGTHAPPTCTDTTTPPDAALVGPGRHPRHRTARGLRCLSHQVRRAADRRRRPARRPEGQQPGTTPLAVIQPPGVPGDDWPAYTVEDRAVMVFDRKCRVEFDPHPHRRIAWDGFSLAQ